MLTVTARQAATSASRRRRGQQLQPWSILSLIVLVVMIMTESSTSRTRAFVVDAQSTSTAAESNQQQQQQSDVVDVVVGNGGDNVSGSGNRGTQLANGMVLNTDAVNVQYLADLIVDVHDISDMLKSSSSNSNTNDILRLYMDGKNSNPPPSSSSVDSPRSLSELSTSLSPSTQQLDETIVSSSSSRVSPPFLFQLYGLAERSTNLDDLSEHLTYADRFVRTSIQQNQRSGPTATGTLPNPSIAAILVLNVWMYAIDGLYEGVQTCQRMIDADNPSQLFETSNIMKGNGGFDQFMALWVGSSTSSTTSTTLNDEVNSLYTLTEFAYRLFTVATSDGDGQSLDGNTLTGNSDEESSSVNRVIQSLYQEAVNIFNLPNVCTRQNAETTKKLWSVVTRLTQQTYIPILQLFIVSILEQDMDSIETYAQAIIPQTSQCRPSTYNRLREALLLPSTDMTSSSLAGRTAFILQDLQSIYGCLGLSCNDIGYVIKSYDDIDGNNNLPQCSQDLTLNPPMALYRPTTDVHPIARIDLDVLQLRILSSLGSFQYAKLWYLYGRNSPRQQQQPGLTATDTGAIDIDVDDNNTQQQSTDTNTQMSYYSISEFAVSSSRRNAEPYYSAFVRYHNDPNYADTLIRNTLDGVGKWDTTKSIAQRSAIVAESSAFLVLYMHLHAQINAAINICRQGTSTDNEDAAGEYELTHPWDEVAALLIGSLEGPDEGGSGDVQDGQLVWGLGTRRAFQFQTLNQQGYANVNSQLEDLIFAGRGELDAVDCNMLETTANSIQTLTLVPLMQSVLKYAIQNEDRSSDSTSADLALGEVYGMSLIPIAQLYDQASSEILEDNMIVREGLTFQTRDGAQVVANAIGTIALSAGLQPKLLGSTPDADPCQLFGCSSASSVMLSNGALSLLAFSSIVFTII